MPFYRRLPENLLAALSQNTFWENVRSDDELQPEIRNNVISIYYKGRALVRELKIQKGVLTASVHHKFVPLQRSTQSESLGLSWNDRKGFLFEDALSTHELGVAVPSTLKAYKRLMEFEAGPEDRLQQYILTNQSNQILDQQVAFSEADRSNKIDLCFFSPSTGKLCFAEIKRCDDTRLFGPADEPEVVRQLRTYAAWLRNQTDSISVAYRRVVQLKRKLGLGDRIQSVPNDKLPVLTKPVLVIGNCTKLDVRNIKKARNAGVHEEKEVKKWMPLWNRLEGVAAGLILCGKKGCGLDRQLGSDQQFWFEET